MRKEYLPFFVLVIFVFTFSGCYSSDQIRSVDHIGTDYSILSNLAEVLRRQGGLDVKGIGDQVQVHIRGMNSFRLNTEPLYIINNMPVGQSYADANSALNVKDIVAVQVLRSYSETNSYGELGRNGVIKIRTRTAPR
ncbi:MAG: TonB-dependent receptor plug domain-containing protein [Saprospiraceae bacterium]|nr:TonB-dependent receptor plug domain-containing protein [Saprospiraceae bacterium]